MPADRNKIQPRRKEAGHEEFMAIIETNQERFMAKLDDQDGLPAIENGRHGFGGQARKVGDVTEQ
jgi:hypothetical protein